MPERCQREINALAPHRRVTASERAGGRGKKDEAAATRHDERRLCPLSQGAAFHLQKVILFKMIKSNGTFFCGLSHKQRWGTWGEKNATLYCGCTHCLLSVLAAFQRTARGRISEAFRFLFVPKEKVAAAPPPKLRPTSPSSRPPISQATSSLKEYITSQHLPVYSQRRLSLK